MDRLVFISGATGYVGTVLAPLVAQKYKVRAFDTEMFGNAIVNIPNIEFIKGDIRDKAAVARALRGVTDVIHLAGIVTDKLVDMNVSLGREINNDALFRFCEIARMQGVQRFIYASSSSVYGTHMPEGESHLCTEDCIPNPGTEYAWTKLRGDYIVNNSFWDMCTTSIRSATACGPAPRMRLDTVVNTFSKQAYFDKKITVHDGTQWRSNIHVLDVAELYKFLLDAPEDLINKQVFNLTAGNHQVYDLAETVRRVMVLHGIDCRIEIEDIVDKNSYKMSAEKLLNILRWQPKYNIVDAIEDNRAFFDLGAISDPNNSLYWNTARMSDFMRKA